MFVKNDTKLLVFMETYGKIEGTDTRAYQREVEFPDGTHRKVYCLHHPTEIRMFEYLMILDADYEQIQRFIKIGRYIKYSWEK